MHHHAPILALCALLSLVSSGPAGASSDLIVPVPITTSVIPTAMADNMPMPMSSTNPLISSPHAPSISTPSTLETTPTPTPTPSTLPTAMPNMPGMNMSMSMSMLTSTLTKMPTMSMSKSSGNTSATAPVTGAGGRVRLRSVRVMSLVLGVLGVVAGVLAFA